VEGLRHDAGSIEANAVNRDCGLADAYCHLAPVVDTDAYTRWLLEELRAGGCLVAQRHVRGPLREQEAALCGEFGATVIVNCAGLGARELAQDEMYPLRGALIRMINDGWRMPRVNQAHCISISEGERRQDMIYVIPRGESHLMLGGLVEPNEWGLDINLENYQPIRDMLRRCQEFLPALREGEIDANEPVRVGLRPMRPANVRLEREPGAAIIHNYGHGGSGVTLSWGCAQEVADLAETVRSE
jgi:D-amino-acid oxidase